MKVIRAPQMTVNDLDVLVCEWIKADKEYVKSGEIIGSLESSKAAFEIEAEADGYFRPIAHPGERVSIGAILCAITEVVDEPIDSVSQPEDETDQAVGDTTNRRWTKKAELLAGKHGIAIDQIPAVGMIQEADVERYLSQPAGNRDVRDFIDDVYTANRAERVLLIGGGRGSVQVLDVLCRSASQRAVGIVDDNTDLVGTTIMGIKILGAIEAVSGLIEDGAFDKAVITFSNDLAARAQMFEDLSEKGVHLANIIDPSVSIHSNVAMGSGNVIMANARIGSCAVLGDNNFLSAYVNIEHHNVLGSHCTFGPGVLTSSRVTIGDRVRFGTGVFLEPGVKIGADSLVASGSIVTSDIPANSILKTKIDSVIRSRNKPPEEISSDA